MKKFRHQGLGVGHAALAQHLSSLQRVKARKLLAATVEAKGLH